MASPRRASAQDSSLLVFEVDDVDQAVQSLQGKGVSFIAMPTDRPDWGMRTAHFRDPDGNLLEIFHPLPMS
ncbi:MAG: VOC family protein [Chloroflexi bacterium]|nr:VOC family protein [Chloroflexota bacterium]